MAKVIDSMNKLEFVKKNLVKGNCWHIFKELNYSTSITYCNMDFEPQDCSWNTVNNEQYEWQFGKKWQPENICPKCVKNFELVVA